MRRCRELLDLDLCEYRFCQTVDRLCLADLWRRAAKSRAVAKGMLRPVSLCAWISTQGLGAWIHTIEHGDRREEE